jgi:Na+-translocating ferredoxin:NAD+ oxidoreductase RnfD subunit
MNIFTWVREHFLATLAGLAAIWWFMAGEQYEQLAFFSFAVIYGAYYIERMRKHPMKNFRMARGQLMFDLVLCAFMAIVTIGGQSAKLDIAAAIVFVIAITGTDLVQFLRLRRQGRQSK